MYSEADTRSKFIDPALFSQGWSENQIIREWYFTDGRKLPGNKRGKQSFIDYLLKDFGQNLAIIEAKKFGLPPTEGLEQVKQYGKQLDVRWVYSTNGQQIYEWDMEEGIGKFVSNFPTPNQLYERYKDENAIIRQQILSIPYYIDSNKQPRYYQQLAITKALIAIANGQDRILLTLATGTGKTYIAFQIVYKLLMSKWSKNGFNRRARILFLADRNILIDQAINTFNPIEKDIKQITGKEIKKAFGKVPTNANVFFSIYQAIISGDDEEENENVGNDIFGDKNIEYYKQYDPNFFDLIIIDECHRGGAKNDGNWANILKYFSSATQLGMTATPKRQDNVDTYGYFGQPVYEYSLKQGINDGFLTPYKVKRIKTNIDELVIDSDVQITSGTNKKDFYELNSFEKEIVIPERTELIAKTILKQIGTYEKTIIFCVDQTHAANIRDAINSHKQVRDMDYCVRVTSNEGDIGKNFLSRFQDNDKTIPTILTSSQMLTTGVDAKNVRNIVLVRNIGSMSEFKQIIGRGTRVFEGKDFFTILDFVGATQLFYDEAWDGETLIQTNETKTPKEKEEKEIFLAEKNIEEKETFEKVYVKLNNRDLKIINIETRYIDENGKPVSATQFLENLVGKLPAFYQSEDQLRQIWADPKAREILLNDLKLIGLDKEQFENMQKMFEAPESDIFDILSHLSFGQDIKTKKERVEYVLENGDIEEKNNQASEFLRYILDYYEKYGSTQLVQSKMSGLIELYGKGNISVVDLTSAFGGIENLMSARKDIQQKLFKI